MGKAGKMLIIMLLASFAVGAIVMLIKRDYRIDDIIQSNRDYYPNVRVKRSSD